MAANSRAPDKLSRDDLESELSRLRELEKRIDALESLIGTLGDTTSEEAGLSDVTLAGSPAGKMLDKNNRRIKKLQSANESDGETNRLGGNRDQMLPIHRMYGDLVTGAGHALADTKQRAACLFGEFVRRVVNGEATKVGASGQMYTLTSAAAEEALLGKSNEDGEDLLSGVKKQSRSQVVARAMREVARLSTVEDCDCEAIDECDHVEIEFRPGRPNVLATPKQSFRESMAAVYDTDSDSSTDEIDEREYSLSPITESNTGESR